MSRRVLRSAVVAATVGCLLGAPVALAEYGPKLDLDELTEASIAIVRGHVYSVDAGWGDVANIYTYVRVDVAEVLSGDSVPERIVVKQLGGVVGEIGQYVGGAPAYRPGDEVVLHLVLRPRDQTVYTAGYWQGMWRVQRDGSSVRVHRNAGFDADGAEVQGETLELETLRSAARSGGPAVRAPGAMVQWVPAEAPPAVNTVFNPEARKFSLLGFSWHEVFDRTAIPFNFHKTRQPGVGNGRKQTRRIVVDWNGVKRTATALKKGKKKGGAAPGSNLRSNDASVLIQNQDPNQEVSDSDGTLAVGGAWFFQNIAIRGLSRAVSGYILMNDSQDDFLTNRTCFENIARHEAGHAWGQGHSNKTGNLMFPSVSLAACTGGKLKLGKDDQRGHRKMYHRKFLAREGQ